MTLVRWNPVRELASMEIDRLNHMFDNLWGAEREAGRFVPPVDIYETDQRDVVIRVELPGMKREDIAITVEQNVLTISGERKYEPDVQRERFHRLERCLGTFSRSFTLPDTVDMGKIRAEYKNGLLTVTIPQKPGVRPKEIPVTV